MCPEHDRLMAACGLLGPHLTTVNLAWLPTKNFLVIEDKVSSQAISFLVFMLAQGANRALENGDAKSTGGHSDEESEDLYGDNIDEENQRVERAASQATASGRIILRGLKVLSCSGIMKSMGMLCDQGACMMCVPISLWQVVPSHVMAQSVEAAVF